VTSPVRGRTAVRFIRGLLPTIGACLLINAGLVVILHLAPPGSEITHDQFAKLLDGRAISSAMFLDYDGRVLLRVCEEAAGSCPQGNARSVWMAMPGDQQLRDRVRLENSGAHATFEDQAFKRFLARIAYLILPTYTAALLCFVLAAVGYIVVGGRHRPSPGTPGPSVTGSGVQAVS
jgi:hypothetical protein